MSLEPKLTLSKNFIFGYGQECCMDLIMVDSCVFIYSYSKNICGEKNLKKLTTVEIKAK